MLQSRVPGAECGARFVPGRSAFLGDLEVHLLSPAIVKLTGWAANSV